jgi:hypothetical protein
MSIGEWVDAQERDTQRIAVDEGSGNLTFNYPRENSCHPV